MVLETYPKSVAAADIDGDGKTDLAVQLYDVGLVSVYRNIGAGDGNGEGSISFAAKKDFETDNGPAALHAADLDGDGRVDLVVTNYDAGTVSILRNTSSKGVVSFAGRTDLAAARAPLGTVIADLDGDGKPDLAVANTIDNTVSVLRNMGNVSFGAKIDYATDAIPQTVVSADFDGDGRPDLATADLYAPTVAILYRDSVIRKDTAAVAMQRLSVASSLTVYPNPVTDRLMAFVPGIYYDSWFRLIDMNGKLMEILPVRAGTTQVSIAMSSFSRGVYRLVWTDGINLYSQAIVRQ